MYYSLRYFAYICLTVATTDIWLNLWCLQKSPAVFQTICRECLPSHRYRAWKSVTARENGAILRRAKLWWCPPEIDQRCPSYLDRSDGGHIATESRHEDTLGQICEHVVERLQRVAKTVLISKICAKQNDKVGQDLHINTAKIYWHITSNKGTKLILKTVPTMHAIVIVVTI